jgi:hypothetical protein
MVGFGEAEPPRIFLIFALIGGEAANQSE